MKLNSKIISVIVLVVMFGGVLTAVGVGLWSSEEDRTPSTLDLNALEAAGVDVDGTVVYDPEDIRGSSSFAEISDYFGVPVDVLATAFMVPEDEDASFFQNKDLEEVCVVCDDDMEVGNGSVKFFVSLYNGIPYVFEDGDEDVYLFAPAVEILKDRGNLDDEMIAYLDGHTINNVLGEVVDDDGEVVEVEVVEEEHDENEMKVNRNTNFAEVLSWGVSQEDIEGVLGMEMPNKLTMIFDFCSENELSFGTIKTELQVLVDELVVE